MHGDNPNVLTFSCVRERLAAHQIQGGAAGIERLNRTVPGARLSSASALQQRVFLDLICTLRVSEKCTIGD